MKKWLRRVRGAVGMGLTWAAAWFGASAAINLLSAVLLGGSAGIIGMVLNAVAGFVGGAAFSVVVGVTEGRRRFDQMSLRRFAAWGALGSLPAGLTMSWFMAGAIGAMGGSIAVVLGITVPIMLLGAGSAAGSLALARRADGRELLDASADVAEIGLTEEETHELLGT